MYVKNDKKYYLFQALIDIIINRKDDYMRCVGTVVRGIRTGIIKENDNLANIVVDSLIKASENDNFTFKLNDIKMYKFYDFLDNNNFILKDDIYLNNKNEYSFDKYKKIIKPLEDISIDFTNPIAFSGNGKYYDKYYRAASPYCSFFFATFNYNNMVEDFTSTTGYIRFNCFVDSNNEVNPQKYE